MRGLVRNLALMMADAACICGCWAIVVLAYYACGGGYTPAFYLQMWPVIVAFLLLNVLFRLYHGRFFCPASQFSPVEEMRRLVGSAIIIHIGVIAVLALLRQTTVGYSRVVIVLSGLLTAFLTQTARDLVRKGLKRTGLGQLPVVALGDKANTAQLVSVLQTNAHVGFSVVGETDDPQQAMELAKKFGVKTLFVCEDVRLFRCHLQTLSQWFAYIEYLPVSVDFPVAGSRTVTFDGLSGIEMVNQGRIRVLRVEKWLLDKMLASLAFVALVPFLIIIAVLVKCSSPGPILFRHERLGKKGRAIWIWKFRTMYADAEERLQKILAENADAAREWREKYKLKNDPRVTPLGRLLRKTSLDEIPQIFNVLGGTMALVGPRPIVEAEKKYYGGQYAILASVKPGMTGLWQVSGRSQTNYARRVSLDTQYALNWSPWMDVWILIRTVWSVILMKGAC